MSQLLMKSHEDIRSTHEIPNMSTPKTSASHEKIELASFEQLLIANPFISYDSPGKRVVARIIITIMYMITFPYLIINLTPYATDFGLTKIGNVISLMFLNHSFCNILVLLIGNLFSFKLFFKKSDQHWQTLGLSKHVQIQMYLAKNRLKTKKILSIFLIIYAMATLPLLFGMIFQFPAMDIIIFGLCMSLIGIHSAWVNICFLYSLLMNVSFVESSFIFIADQVFGLDLKISSRSSDPRVEKQENETDLQMLKDIRCLYEDIVTFVNVLDNLWMFYVPLFLAYFFFVVVGSIYSFVYISKDFFSDFGLLSWTIITSINAYIMLNRIVSIPKHSFIPFDPLYKFSFSDTSFAFKNELNLFMQRIQKRDIGFTFFKLLVLAPNFIWTLTTIIASFVVAIPNVRSATKTDLPEWQQSEINSTEQDIELEFQSNGSFSRTWIEA